MYEERTYRQLVDKNKTKSFIIKYQLTDLLISVDRHSYNAKLPELVMKYLKELYKSLNGYIAKKPVFCESHLPLKDSECNIAIIKDMLEASCIGSVGPMAAIAGAISEYVGQFLIGECKVQEVIVENGGDIFVYTQAHYIDTVIYCGKDSFFKSLNIHIENFERPLGICTSSGKVGHSFSYGIADAVTIISRSATIADAFATHFGNLIKKKDDIVDVMEKINEYELVLGMICVCDDKVGIYGKLELLSIMPNDLKGLIMK